MRAEISRVQYDGVVNGDVLALTNPWLVTVYILGTNGESVMVTPHEAVATGSVAPISQG